MKANFLFILICSVVLAACQPEAADKAPDAEAAEATEAGEMTLYTHRHYESDQELIARFTEETGIKVNVVNASADELILKLENESCNYPTHRSYYNFQFSIDDLQIAN